MTFTKYFPLEPPEVRLIQEVDSDRDQSTTDILKDMITQKKNLLLSKLTSFDSDVSDVSLKFGNLSWCDFSVKDSTKFITFFIIYIFREKGRCMDLEGQCLQDR